MCCCCCWKGQDQVRAKTGRFKISKCLTVGDICEQRGRGASNINLHALLNAQEPLGTVNSSQLPAAPPARFSDNMIFNYDLTLIHTPKNT